MKLPKSSTSSSSISSVSNSALVGARDVAWRNWEQNFDVAQLQDEAVGEYLSETLVAGRRDVELKRQIISGLCKLKERLIVQSLALVDELSKASGYRFVSTEVTQFSLENVKSRELLILATRLSTECRLRVATSAPPAASNFLRSPNRRGNRTMELKRSTFRQRLSYGTCAIALVCTLSLYKSNVTANPLSVAQNHWSAIASENPELLATRYSDRAVLKRSYGSTDVQEVYQGQSIYSAWQKFFFQYQIQDFQVLSQERHDRSVEAQIQITAQSNRGSLVVLSMSYQVKFDASGKILEEVWQANPEQSV